MLQSIHDKSKGWLAYVVVGFICIPFVFWGINEYIGGGGSLLVAEVNGKEITTQQYRNSLQQRKQQMRELMGGSIPEDVLDSPELKQGVLAELIREELLRQFSQDKGFRVSDIELSSAIHELPIFRENGAFSSERYTKLLEAQRIPKATFEHNLRSGIELEQYERGISSSEFLTDAELEQFLQLKGQIREISYGVLKTSTLESQVQVTEEEILEYFSANTSKYNSEEQIKLAYVVLDPQVIEDAVEVTDEDALSLFEQESDRYQNPESRQVSQILISSSEGGDEAAHKEADTVHERLSAGESFSAIAAELSDDSLSANKGGDLGLIFPGDMAANVDAAIFSLDISEISEPVKVPQGYLILKVVSVIPSSPKQFVDVQEELKTELRKREADSLFSSKANDLLTVSYENPTSLDAVSDAVGVEIKSSDYITRKTTDARLDKNLVEAAFSQDVLVNGNNSDVITMADGRQAVVRVADHKPSTPLPLTEVKSDVSNELSATKLRSLAKSIGEDILSKVKSGEVFASAVQHSGADLNESTLVERLSSDLPKELVNEVFRMASPKTSPEFSGMVLADGSYAVVKLDKVITPKVTSSDPSGVQFRKALENSYAQRGFDTIYRSLAAQSDIKVYNDSL